jgi:hypothetical protein
MCEQNIFVEEPVDISEVSKLQKCSAVPGLPLFAELTSRVCRHLASGSEALQLEYA